MRVGPAAVVSLLLWLAVAPAAQGAPTARTTTLRLVTKPASSTTSRTAAFAWRRLGSGRCKLDTRHELPCRSSRRYRHLLVGTHRFRLRIGSRSIAYRWRVVRRAPRHPAAPPQHVPAGPPAMIPPPEPPSLPAVADEPVTLAAEPPLRPAFAPDISDYTVRCADQPVQITATSGPNTRVSIDGAAPQIGAVAGAVSLAENEGFGVRVDDPSGARTYHVRCVPADMPEWSFARDAAPEPGFTIVTPSQGSAGRYVTIFDDWGVPVWWLRAQTPPLDAKLLSDDTIAYSRSYGVGYGNDPNMAYEIRRLDGSLVRVVQSVGGSPTDHHELIEAGAGTLLLFTYRPRDHVDLSPYGGPPDATVVDGEIQLITPRDTVAWSWNSKDHLSLSETGRWWPTVIANPMRLPSGELAYDPVHVNAMSIRGEELLVSVRHADALYAISRSTGDVLWKLGGSARAESLTVAGTPTANLFGGQHDVRALDDGTITVYDNGTGLGRAPRALRIALDEPGRAAAIVESVADPTVPDSICCGSARRLAGGGWLIGWGGVPMVGEYDAHGMRRSTLRFEGNFSYRAVPIARGRISAASLRTGMDERFPRGRDG